MDESQVLGHRIARLENWFLTHPGVFDGIKRDELRTLYNLIGDERKFFEQSDIILANQFNDEKTLSLLSGVDSSPRDDVTKRVEKLLSIASRNSQFKNLAAAARLRAGNLLAASGRKRSALAAYRQVFKGPVLYARKAKERYRKIAGA